MKKLRLKELNPGSHQNEVPIIKRVQSFENCLAEISETMILIKKDNQILLKSELQKISEFFGAIYYKGSFDDNTQFRVVMQNEWAKKLIEADGDKVTITIASMSGDGYAAHFYHT